MSAGFFGGREQGGGKDGKREDGKREGGQHGSSFIPVDSDDDPDKAACVAALDEWFAFQDKDSSGTLTLDEVRASILFQAKRSGDAFHEEEVDNVTQEAMQKMDTNEDGLVTKAEFMKFYLSSDRRASYAEYAKMVRTMFEITPH